MGQLAPVRRTAGSHTTAGRDGAVRRARRRVLAASAAAAGALGLILLAAPATAKPNPPMRRLRHKAR